MKYVFLVIIGLLIGLWFMKIKLEINVKKDKTEGNIIISNLFKYKISLDRLFTSKPKKIKDILKMLKTITNPLIRKVFSKAVVEVVNIELYMDDDNNPYWIFAGHMLLIELRSLLYKYFERIEQERFKVGLEEEKSNGKILISINLGKLVIIILQNYNHFKKIITNK